jgi:feruloyl esterase
MRKSILLTVLLGVSIFVALPVFVALPAQAANLNQVTGFGSNPGNLAMYHYKPDGVANGHAVVVLLHGCTQTASGYFTNSGWRKFADQHGFALVIPQQNSSNNALSCFNWFQAGDIARGQGEALSIRNMVGYAVSNLGASGSRVFVSGLSAGGAMAAVMLATYPDVFKAGSIAAGLAYKCTTTCQTSPPDQTPAQWGDLARSGYPGYNGPYPRVAIWQGSSDTTVAPANATELRDQWTNVRGVSATPTSTSSLPGGTTLEVYGNNNDVRLHRISGMAHGLPVDPGTGATQCGTAASYFLDTICSAYYDTAFFGLSSGSPGPSPSPTPTPTPTPSPTSAPVCVTSSNYQHTVAGRAYMSLGYTYANGSNQNMGLWNTFNTTTLRQTGPNYWVIGC